MTVEDDGTNWKKAKIIIRKAIPCSINNGLLMIQQLVNIAFLGQLNKPEVIAGVGIGSMTITILGFGFVCGLNGALEQGVSLSYG